MIPIEAEESQFGYSEQTVLSMSDRHKTPCPSDAKFMINSMMSDRHRTLSSICAFDTMGILKSRDLCGSTQVLMQHAPLIKGHVYQSIARQSND